MERLYDTTSCHGMFQLSLIIDLLALLKALSSLHLLLMCDPPSFTGTLQKWNRFGSTMSTQTMKWGRTKRFGSTISTLFGCTNFPVPKTFGSTFLKPMARHPLTSQQWILRLERHCRSKSLFVFLQIIYVNTRNILENAQWNDNVVPKFDLFYMFYLFKY